MRAVREVKATPAEADGLDLRGLRQKETARGTYLRRLLILKGVRVRAE